MGKFRPEYAGKLNLYLSAVDDLLRDPADASTIGLLLCRGTDGLVVEYDLRDIQKPIGVSSFRVIEALPAALRGALPTVEQLEAELTSWSAQIFKTFNIFDIFTLPKPPPNSASPTAVSRGEAWQI